jgi:hypothetical protein
MTANIFISVQSGLSAHTGTGDRLFSVGEWDLLFPLFIKELDEKAGTSKQARKTIPRLNLRAL